MGNIAKKRGRKSDPVTKHKRKLLNAKKDLDAAQNIFDARLKPTGDKALDSARRKNAETRFVINQGLRPILTDLFFLTRRDDLTASEEAKVNELKADRDKAFGILNALPGLGFSETEWLALPEETRRKPNGRPKLSDEMRLVNAGLAYDEALAAYRACEKEMGLEPVSEELLFSTDIPEAASHGRPSSGIFPALERKLRDAQRVIESIDNGDAEAKIDQGIAARKNPSRGRNFEDISVKRERFVAKCQELKEAIAREESLLDAKDALERRIILARRDVQALDSNTSSVKSMTAQRKLEKLMDIRKRKDWDAVELFTLKDATSPSIKEETKLDDETTLALQRHKSRLIAKAIAKQKLAQLKKQESEAHNPQLDKIDGDRVLLDGFSRW